MLRLVCAGVLVLSVAAGSKPLFAAEIAKPPMVARTKWELKPAARTALMVKQAVPLQYRGFVIHHTGTEHRLRKAGNRTKRCATFKSSTRGINSDTGRA